MMDLGFYVQHGPEEVYCPSCGTPESAGLGQHGMDCEIVRWSAT